MGMYFGFITKPRSHTSPVSADRGLCTLNSVLRCLFVGSTPHTLRRLPRRSKFTKAELHTKPRCEFVSLAERMFYLPLHCHRIEVKGRWIYTTADIMDEWRCFLLCLKNTLCFHDWINSTNKLTLGPWTTQLHTVLLCYMWRTLPPF